MMTATLNSSAIARRIFVSLSILIGLQTYVSAQTPTGMLNPPPGMCGIEYPITPSFSYNETRFLGVGLQTDFTYTILTPVAGPTITETRGVGALSSGATSYVFATPITSGLTAGVTNTIRFCVGNSGGSLNCATYSTMIYLPTVGGTITGTQSSICNGNSGGTMTLSGYTGTIYDWEQSIDMGATWTAVNAGARTITATFAPGALTQTTYYRAIVRSGFTNAPMPAGTVNPGACDAEYSSNFVITVYDYPAAPSVGSNSPVCSGNTISLTAASPAGGATYAWTTTATTPFTSNFQNPNISNATTSMSGNYSCTVTANGCTSTPGTVAVLVNQTPVAPTLSSNTPVCTGNDLNLFANAVAGGTFTWTGPNSFNDNVEDPTIIAASIAAEGTYSATVTVAGCTSPIGTTSVPVDMVPRPAAPVAGSNSPICSGQTVNLTATTIPSATYTWSGPAPYTSAVQNPTIPGATPANSGTYSVFATSTLLAGCSSTSTSTNVVVNPLPAAPTISSNTPVCTGGTLNLSSNTFNSSTYNWTGPNGFSSSLQNPAISLVPAAAAGTYTLTITTSATGCTGPSSTTNVVVNPTPASPTAANNGPICEGTTLTLTGGTVPGATSYNWTGPGGFSSTTLSPTVTTSATATNDGNYSITATAGGCTSAPTTTVAIVKDQPDAPVLSSNSPVCVGATLNLFAATVPGATYAWNGPGGYTSPSQNPVRPTATIAMSGTYTCTVTVNGCTSPAASIDILVSPIPATPTVSSNTPVCSGAVLNLTTPAVTSATYSWTGPNSFASSSQNPSIANVTTAATGTYSVTVTVGGCPSAPGTGAVVINATPATPTPASNSPVCSGSALNLTTSTVAGATYSWTGPAAFTPSASQNPTVASATTAHSGMYYVTVTVNSCTSAAGSTSVTVNQTPSAPVLGSNSPVCEGSTLNLTSNVVTGATYNWSGPASFTSTFQNPSVSNVTLGHTGTYTLVTSVASCTSSATINVTINPRPAQPTAGTNAPICEGSTLNLTCSTLSGATYSWTTTSSTGFTSSLQNPTIASATTAHSGTYSVTTTAAGCTSLPGTVSVAVNAIPNAPVVSNNSPVCTGGTINLFANTVTGATYGWTGPGGFTPTSTQNPTIPSATAANAGTYSCTITINGCTSSPSTTSVSVIATPATPSVTSNSPMCEGTTLNLSATNVPGATYSWTGPNGFTANTRNPSIPLATAAASGTYSVIATIGSCSSAAGTGNVTVTPTPAAPAVSSNTPVCVGGTINLTASNVAGATYAWTGPGSPAYSSAVQNPSIPSATAANNGIYTCIATVSGCSSGPSSTSVSVNPVPAAPTAGSNSPACTGGSINLTASTIIGATYNWTGPNSFSSSLQNPTVSNVVAASAGVYSVVATVGGCTGPAGTTNVVINTSPAAPVASSDGPVCVGSTLNLMASNVGGATYSWTGPNGFSAATQNPSFVTSTPNESGTYSVVAIAGGCSSVPGTIAVNVYAIPAAPVVSSNSPVCEGSVLNLFAEQVQGASYAWSTAGGYSSTVQNPTINSVQMSDATTYDVVITVNGCVSPSASTNVVVNDTPNAPTAGSNSPLCAGDDLNLTASSTTPGVSYNWNGPGSPAFTSTSQNPTITNVSSANAGSYFVTATLGSCTSPSGIAPVTVSTAPTTLTASYNSAGTLCEGSTLQLSASPNVSGAIYNWSGPAGYFSSEQNPAIPNVQTSQAGTYSVICTVGGGCSGTPATVNVVVTNSPNPPTSASSNSPVCEGATLNLTAQSVAGATYDWTGPNFYTSTTQNPSFTAASNASGTYSVRSFDGTCYSSPVDVPVTIIAAPMAPVASVNNPICQGSTINLSASTIPGATYSWTGPGSPTFSSSLQNPTIPSASAINNGTYNVTATAGGCVSPVGSVTVIVTAPDVPVAGNDGPACAGTNVQLTASTISGATYSWSGPGGYTSSTQNPVLVTSSPTQSGVYSVTATINGCVGQAGTTTVVVNAASVGGSVSGSATVCAGSNGGPLTLTGHSGTIVYWLASTDGGATWVIIANTTATLNYSNLMQTTMYAAGVQQGSCPIAMSSPATITVIPEAVGGVISNNSPSAELCLGDNQGILTLTGYAGNIIQWEVTTDGGATWDTIANTTDTISYTNLTENTTYRVLVQGCTSYKYSAAEVLVVTFAACNDDIVIATMVTPNADGHNDTWLIEDLASYPPMHVTIMNRYGTQIYQTDHYLNEWDATYNGDLLPDGTYYYVIKMDGSDKVLKGHINILK